jgi:hypothetical protein
MERTAGSKSSLTAHVTLSAKVASDMSDIARDHRVPHRANPPGKIAWHNDREGQTGYFEKPVRRTASRIPAQTIRLEDFLSQSHS